MVKTALAAVALVAAAAGSAAAQYAPTTYAPPKEHRGLFVRVFLGPAYTQSSAEYLGNSFKMSGGGGAFGLAVGYSVTPQIVVFGELFDDVAFGPTVEINGQASTADEDVAAGVVGVGVGAAYWIQPANAYVSGTLSLSQLTVQEDGREVADTESGPGVSLMLGKEWWVAQDVGLGLAVQAFLGTQTERDNSDVKYTTSAFALAVTGSYN